MKRQRILWIVLDSVFIIIFNIFFFSLSKSDLPASVWVNYFFIHLSYILLLCTSFLVRRGNSGAADYARPLYLGTSSYFLITLQVGVILIIISPQKAKASWLIHVSLLAVAAVYLIANMISNEHIADNMGKQEKDLQYIKKMSARLKPLITEAHDSEVSRRIERLYDTVMASPVKSNENAQVVEAQLIGMLAELEDSVNEGKAMDQTRIIDEMQKLVNRRNSML